MLQLSANIEVLFKDVSADFAGRARAAADAGFKAVEMWGTSDKDISALAAVVRERALDVSSIVAEPNVNLVFPGADISPLHEGLDKAFEAAAALGCRRIIVRPGMGFPGFNRSRNLDRLAEIYADFVERVSGTDFTLLLEPVNTRVDHPGLLLDRTKDAVRVIRAVGSPRLRLLFDCYHSATEGEVAEAELPASADVLGYVQFADSPGRGEPGAGTIDWPAILSLLARIGYSGPVGLEHVPVRATVDSVQYVMGLLRDSRLG